MDVESVASAAGTSLVTALTSKVAGEAISKVVAVFSKKKSSVEVAADLEKSKAAIRADPENCTGEAYIWKQEFLGLLRDYPEALADVRALIEALTPLAREENLGITQTVVGSQGVTQVGRDMFGTSEPRQARKRWRD